MITLYDTPLVAALLSHGFNYTSAEKKESKIGFSFEENPNLIAAIQLYKTGDLMVSALVYSTQYKGLLHVIKSLV